MSGSDFVASFSPVPMATKVAKRRSLYRRTLRSSIFSLILTIGLYYWQRDSIQGFTLGAMSGLWVLVVVVLAVMYFLLWQARRALGRVGHGQAFRITAQGMELGSPEDGRRVGWSEITGLSAQARAGHGARLVVTMRDSTTWTVPLDFLDALPGTIDSAARAFSAGRLGLDLSRLDSAF